MTLSNHNTFNIDSFRQRLTTLEQQELLRFVAVGSVDDGKSTLIGRLLHDTEGAYTDQIEAIAARSKDGQIDFALLTDGLNAEREQGITIDVAYRYFSTVRRKFIIADTPGHLQFTRNMITGASTADVAIILIDARHGVLPQTRRHAFITSMLGISRLVVAVNKMDLVSYDEQVYRAIVADVEELTKGLRFKEVVPLPISAVEGDNVAEPSERTPWFSGQTLLNYLETCPIDTVSDEGPLRFPIQTVLRPNLDYRAFAGSVVRGQVRPGDSVKVLPSGQTSTVKAIDTYEGSIPLAFAPMSVAIRLEDEIDISRGDMIVPADDPSIQPRRRFDSLLVWMDEEPLDPDKAYLIKHTTRVVPAKVERIDGRLDVETLDFQRAAAIGLNDIAQINWLTHRPLFSDPYASNRDTGAFIVIDSLTNHTVAAGMIVEQAAGSESSEALDSDIAGLSGSRISSTERVRRFGHIGLRLTLVAPQAMAEAARSWAWSFERAAFDRGHNVLLLLDGPSPELAAAASSAGLLVVSLEQGAAGEPAHLMLSGSAAAADLSPEEQRLALDSIGDTDETSSSAVLSWLNKLGLLAHSSIAENTY